MLEQVACEGLADLQRMVASDELLVTAARAVVGDALLGAQARSPYTY
jgi:hypothetical protein